MIRMCIGVVLAAASIGGFIYAKSEAERRLFWTGRSERAGQVKQAALRSNLIELRERMSGEPLSHAQIVALDDSEFVQVRTYMSNEAGVKMYKDLAAHGYDLADNAVANRKYVDDHNRKILWIRIASGVGALVGLVLLAMAATAAQANQDNKTQDDDTKADPESDETPDD